MLLFAFILCNVILNANGGHLTHVPNDHVTWLLLPRCMAWVLPSSRNGACISQGRLPPHALPRTLLVRTNSPCPLPLDPGSPQRNAQTLPPCPGGRRAWAQLPCCEEAQLLWVGHAAGGDRCTWSPRHGCHHPYCHPDADGGMRRPRADSDVL